MACAIDEKRQSLTFSWDKTDGQSNLNAQNNTPSLLVYYSFLSQSLNITFYRSNCSTLQS